MTVLLVFFVVLAILAVAARYITRGSDSSSHSLELLLSDDSIADRYRPMERLLHDADWKYLSVQPGYTPSRVRKFRALRRTIFRRYLEGMNADFSALCLLVRSLMVESAVDRPDLASALFKIRSTYFLSLIKIHFALSAQAAGIDSIQIDISGITRSLEEIGAQVRSLQLVADPTFA